jgi:AraC family transcriptional regulator
MLRNIDLLTLVGGLGSPAQDTSLDALARRSGWSRFHLHRAFREVLGETPKQYTLRLRVTRAAAALLTTDDTVEVISRAAGFNSHEVFTRAFRRRFDCSPHQYRRRARVASPKPAPARHRRFVERVAPCIRLYHFPTSLIRRSLEMTLLSIERKDVAPMPFLYVRRQVARSELSKTLAECFGIVFQHCMQSGLELAGFPLARYTSVGAGLLTIEAGVPLVKPATPVDEMQYSELPGGPVVLAVHGGAYEDLGDTHAAIERWISDEGLRVAGPHWEWYVTDPGEHPDPKDWRTHIYYPLER